MDKSDKLIIITSSNGPEYENYWGLRNTQHPIVKDGRERGVYKVAVLNQDERISALEEIVDDDGYIIMIHLNQDTKLQVHRFEKSGKTIEFTVYYYSTLDESLKEELWSVDNEYKFTGSEDNPKCLFDRLRNDIIKNTNTEGSVQEIIEWVKSQTNKADLLETKLALLHGCLTSESASKASGIENYNLVKDIIVSENTTVDAFISKYLANSKTQEEHHEKLTILRNALLD